ncbi:MAG: tetratricopeptide repeat protein [Anaerolineae bacterium]|nr:tetratricopeptide repeat protein [Anaerolineae bacterium]
MADTSYEELLHAGIAAVKAGQSEAAREAFIQAIQLNVDDARGWLWLSGVAPTLDERVMCLEKVMALEPENARVRQGLEALYSQQVAVRLREGLAAMEQGDRVHAREVLTQVVTRDESHVEAWWALSQIVETTEECEVCLENVLALVPDHAEARSALDELRSTSPSSAFLVEEIRYEDVTSIPAAPALLFTAPPITHTQGEIAPVPPPTADWDSLDNPYLCPYCAALTDPEDQECPVCDKELWITRPEVEKIRPAYWIYLGVQVAFVLGGGLLPVFLLSYAGGQLGIDNYWRLLPMYLGMAEISPEDMSLLTFLVPRPLVWLSLLPTLLSFLLLVGTLTRWASVYMGLLGMEALRVMVALVSLLILFTQGLGILGTDIQGIQASVYQFGIDLLGRAVIVGNVVVLLATGISYTMLQRIVDHFSTEDRRIVLRLDHDVVGSEIGLWVRGRAYVQQKMWAMAAIHLRYALGLQARLEAYLQLVVACVHLERYDLAEDTLQKARRFSPDSAELDEVAVLLDEKRKDI